MHWKKLGVYEIQDMKHEFGCVCRRWELLELGCTYHL